MFNCRNFASSIFYGVYAIVYIVEPLILHIYFGGAKSIVNGADVPFTDEIVYVVFNAIGIVFLMSGLLISMFRNQTPSGVSGQIYLNGRITDLIGIMIILGLLCFVHGAGSNIMELILFSRFAWVDNENFSILYIVLSAYLIALSPIYIYLVKTKAGHNKVVLVLTLAAIVAYGILTKDRKWVFYIISGWFAAKYHLDNCRIVITQKVVLFMVSLFTVLLLSQFIRDAAPRYFLNESFSFSDELWNWSSKMFEYSDISYFYRSTIEAIEQNVNNNFYIALGLIRRVLFFFLPAGYSGGLKIEDISAIFSDVVGGEDALRRGSMPPGLFGLFVLSFSWIGAVIIIPLLALFLAKLDQIFRGKRSSIQLALISIYLTVVVFAFRGDESTAFYFPVANLLILLCLVGVSKMRVFSISFSKAMRS